MVSAKRGVVHTVVGVNRGLVSIKTWFGVNGGWCKPRRGVNFGWSERGVV